MSGVGQENSAMFPKETRPPYLQDDSYFNKFKPEVALQAVMNWAQTEAMQKANQLKEKKKLSEVSNFHLKLLTFYIAGVAQRV